MNRRVSKQLDSIPKDVLKRYEKWKDIVTISGPQGLRNMKKEYSKATKHVLMCLWENLLKSYDRCRELSQNELSRMTGNSSSQPSRPLKRQSSTGCGKSKGSGTGTQLSPSCADISPDGISNRICRLRDCHCPLLSSGISDLCCIHRQS